MQKIQQQKHAQLLEEKLNDANIMTNPDCSSQQRSDAQHRNTNRETMKRQGQYIRYRGSLIAYKDKMTRFHFAHSAKRFVSSQITAITHPVTKVLQTTQKTIESALDIFWKNIFNKRVTDIETQDVLLSHIDKQLPQQQSNALSVPITTAEIITSANKMKLNKSPGSDGIPVDFYAMMIDSSNDPEPLIMKFMRDTFQESYENKLLPTSMRQILIRLIFKKTTDIERIDPKNYRPISLLNCDYKILSKTLALRLSPIMHLIIDESQSGIPGRHISDPILTAQAIIHRARKHNLEQAIIFLDFEKAFDSVDHEYTFKLMEKMNIHPVFIQWAKLAFTQTNAKLIVNGKPTPGFQLPGGGRQGDNLYPLLFALVMQGLKVTIDNTVDVNTGQHLKGVPIPYTNKRLTLKQYVDDSAIYITSTRDIRIMYTAVTNFCKASGMKINWEKTEGIFLGAWAENPPYMQAFLGPLTPIRFVNSHNEYIRKLKYLGINTGYTKQNEGWLKLKSQILQDTYKSFSKDESDIGKVTKTNAVLIGKINYTSACEYISKPAKKQMAKAIKLATSGAHPILPHHILLTQPCNGNIVTLIDIHKHLHTLHAKPLIIMLQSHYPTAQQNLWYEEIQYITTAIGLYTCDQLLSSPTKLPPVTARHTHNPLVIQSIDAFYNMRYKPEQPRITFYSAAATHILYNDRILDTSRQPPVPWDRHSFIFKKLRHKCFYVIELYSSFSRHAYKTNPNIAPSRRLTPTELNAKFRTRIPAAQWNALTLSIDIAYPHIHQIITQGPNQDDLPKYLASLDDQGNIETVYTLDRYHRGFLRECDLVTRLDMQYIADPTDAVRYPGEVHADGVTPYLLDLKPLTYRTITFSNDEHVDQIINFYITFNDPHPTGLPYTTRQYFSSYDKTTYRDIAKSHRRSSSETPAYLTELHTRVAALLHTRNALVPGNLIHQLVSLIDTMRVVPKTKQMIFRLLHNALYMADQARTHQLRRGFAHWAPQKLYPTQCVLCGAQSTVQHEFFDCPYIKRNWEYTNRLIRQMQLTVTIDSIPNLWAAILMLPKTDCLKHITNINLITLTMKSIWVTYIRKMYHYQQNTPLPERLLKFTRESQENYSREVTHEIYQYANHHKQIINKVLDARAKALQTPFYFNPTKIPQALADTFRHVWCHSDIVSLQQSDIQGFFHLKTEPIVLGQF